MLELFFLLILGQKILIFIALYLVCAHYASKLFRTIELSGRTPPFPEPLGFINGLRLQFRPLKEVVEKIHPRNGALMISYIFSSSDEDIDAIRKTKRTLLICLIALLVFAIEAVLTPLSLIVTVLFTR